MILFFSPKSLGGERNAGVSGGESFKDGKYVLRCVGEKRVVTLILAGSVGPRGGTDA